MIAPIEPEIVGAVLPPAALKQVRDWAKRNSKSMGTVFALRFPLSLK
jgi:hypothetical protein